MSEAIVQLNEGVSGGNAIVDLRELPEPGSVGERPELESRVRGMTSNSTGLPLEQYLKARGAARGMSKSV